MVRPLTRVRPVTARPRRLPGLLPAGRRVPELPEVETVRRAIAPALEGRTLEHVEISDVRLTRPEDPLAVAAELTGERVEHVDRRGKYLIVRFASGRALLIHLRMTGSLLQEPAETTHVRAVLRLDNGRRSATATCAASAPGCCSSRASSSRTSARGWARSRSSPRSRRGPRRAAGGPPRAAEGALCSTSARSRGSGTSTSTRRSGTRSSIRCVPAGSLDRDELRRLHRAIRKALELGIARQGSTLTDYRLPDGSSGLDAEGVQGLRPPRRAVRPLRHAAREDPRRRPRHMVLPALPAALKRLVASSARTC